MKVGIFHAGAGGAHLALAAQLMASVRVTMPGVDIVHLTDDATPALQGVDAVRRRPAAPIALAVLEAYAGCDGDWLLLDSDTRILRDVRPVFDQGFDLAVATREGTLRDKEVGSKFMDAMPYNKGVVFSREAAFWRAAAAWLRRQPAKLQEWMGDQRAMNAILAEGSWHLLVLPNRFNYPPKSRGEDLTPHAIVHFKGPRKQWALEGM